MRRRTIAVLWACVAGTSGAGPPLPPADSLGRLEQWKVLKGNWTAADGRFRGDSDGALEFPDLVPTDSVLSFTLRVAGVRHPHVDLRGLHLWVACPNPARPMIGISGDVRDVRGDPVPMPNNQDLRCTIEVSHDGHFKLRINGHLISGTCEAAEKYRLLLFGGHVLDGAGTGAGTAYSDLQVRATTGGAVTPRPAGGGTGDDKPTPTDAAVGSIDVPVPCQPVAAATTAPTTAPAAAGAAAALADPDVIARPEFADAPKPLVRPITSVTSMMVRIGNDGEETGLTSDIIATVRPGSRHGRTAGVAFVMKGDGDPMMKTALQEAVRAVQVRYPVWAPGYIDLSFGEKFVSHGGPSAGTAFALLILSTLEDVPLDPACAVTGDVTVDWAVRAVGGVTAKLRGATLDGRTVATIPEANAGAFADVGLLYGHAAWWKIQVFSTATVQQAQAVARKDRGPQLAQAIALFSDLAARLDKAEAAAVRDPKTKATLTRVLQLAPNHLSARAVLNLCEGTAPRNLSIGATEYKLSILFNPYATLLKGGRPLDRSAVTAELTNKTRRRIAALRPIADRSLLSLLGSIQGFAEVLDEYARGGTEWETVRARATAIDDRIDELGADADFTEKEVREGY